MTPHRSQSLPPFSRRPWAARLGIALLAAALFFPRPAFATPTEEDILRSFNQNMDQAPDYGRMIPWLLAAVGAVVIVVCFRNWQKRQAVPKKLNHPRKLVREIVRGIEIDPAEMKRITQLARELNCQSPLTILLCPSLTAKDAQPQSPASAPNP
jgi:hypothetical protein